MMESAYRLRVIKNLSEDWSAWFDELTISSDTSRGRLLVGKVHYQADLFGQFK